jgi:hypothetical protein
MIGEFFLGIVGNLLAKHIDPAGRSLAEIILARLAGSGPALPPNHDVERVCRASLKQSLEMMAQAMDLHIAQPKSLVEAFKHRFDDKGRWKPLLEWWHTDEKAWFQEFVAESASDKALADFDLRWVTGASSLNSPLRSLADAALERQFGDALLEWTERHVQTGKVPDFFATWVRDGWPIAQDSPAIRISLYQCWCLFLQSHFKDDEKARSILTADWLASIDARLTGVALTRDEVSNALLEPLGQHAQLLTELRDVVQTMSADVTAAGETSGRLLALVLEFRGEVGAGFSQLRAQIEATQSQVADIGVTVDRSDRKLDAALENDARILEKLDAMLEGAKRALPNPADHATTAIKRIASSELLASDGAQRFKELVGRDQERALLTSAWRDDKIRVLSIVAWGGVGKTSLVTDWLTGFVNEQWAGVDAFFDWSFYSQGTRDHNTASSDTFFNAALRHFGEDAMAASGTAVEEKAARLAAVMGRQRTLLVLDGLEPLQHPRKPGQQEGRLKDAGIRRLLHSLAQAPNPGLCIVTTRVPVIDLVRFHDTSVQEHILSQLSVRHGAALLHLAGAHYAGAAEIEADDRALLAAARDLKGHAMTLQMLGGYLRAVHAGDILRRDRVDFEKVFEDQLEGHTYNVMEAYEQWFNAEGVRGRRQLAVLRMLGLFDRPADAGCIAALRSNGGIPGISDDVASLSSDDWQITLAHLAEHRLVFADRTTQSLDAHPLVREYFARRLRKQKSDAWRAAHRRLYEHLTTTTQEGTTPTLEDLQPLYQAVVHGCLAGMYREARRDTYRGRILRREENYSTFMLGALASDLGAIACFFEQPWSRLTPELSYSDQLWLLNEAAYSLRGLGRLTEALAPMQAGLAGQIKSAAWVNAAVSAQNLSELQLALGDIASAIGAAETGVELADKSERIGERSDNRATLGNALFQAGRRAEASKHFVDAERVRADNPGVGFLLLRSIVGFHYCELLLTAAEEQAWRQRPQASGLALPRQPHRDTMAADAGDSNLPQACRAVTTRATKTLTWITERRLGFVDVGLNRLSLGRAALYLALLEGADVQDRLKGETQGIANIERAVVDLRRSGDELFVPAALLTRAWLRHLTGALTGSDGAQVDLDEAWDIAERGLMRLVLADIHLHRARLFGLPNGDGSAQPYPWHSPQADLAEARRLIVKHGYLRRKGELEDAELAILGRIQDQ